MQICHSRGLSVLLETYQRTQSSSYNRLYFGHHTVAANSKNFLKLHDVNISEVDRRGVLLARWGVGVTVLLEKSVGVTFVNKARAIYIVEADFDHCTRLFFAQRMMK